MIADNVHTFAYEGNPDIPAGLTVDQYQEGMSDAKRASKDWSRGKSRGVTALVKWAENHASIRAEMRERGIL